MTGSSREWWGVVGSGKEQQEAAESGGERQGAAGSGGERRRAARRRGLVIGVCESVLWLFWNGAFVKVSIGN